MTQVEALAKYAARASYADLSAESRRQLPIHILDSLGCCIAALGAGPVQACREQVAEFGAAGPSTLTTWGYTVQSPFVDHANFMTSGFDHTSQLAFSLNAAAGRLLGLTEPQIASAIAMAAVSDASFAVVRAKPLSQWKGLASSQSALGAMNTLFLARRGVQGPLQVIEGPLGIDHLLRMQINIDWDKEGYEGVVGSTIKKYNSMIHTQSAVHCMVEIARQNKIDPSKVVSIEAEVFQLA